MAVVIDTANVVTVTATTGTTVTLNCTCAAIDNGLLVFVGTDQATINAPPSSLTYNGVALTMLGHQSYTSNYRGDLSVWYLNSPPTGASLVLSAVCANNNAGFAMTAIPLSGASLITPPTVGTPAFATSAAAACSVTGGGANDLQFAGCFIRSSGLASGGAPQAVVPSTPTLPQNGIHGFDGFSVDSIPGTSAGNFSWTLTSGNWIALGVTVFSSVFAVDMGSYSIGGQAVLFSTVATGNLVMLAAPGLYNITGALAIVPAPSLNVATGIYSIAGQLATFISAAGFAGVPFPYELDVYDGLNGSLQLAWGQLLNPPPDSYNVYVNGVLNQNVAGLLATVSGLTREAYNPGTGVITQSGTYHLKVVAVRAGVEITAVHKTVTVNPSSIQLTTPMKRLWPFPNTGLD